MTCICIGLYKLWSGGLAQWASVHVSLMKPIGTRHPQRMLVG
jgi:hypothetical protein